MRRNEKAHEAVESAWGRLQERLGHLADELPPADDDWWDEDSSDAASVGKQVNDLSEELAAALSEWLPEIPAHDKLDAFLHELASRRKGETFTRAARTAAELLEFLRQISYGALPSIAEVPDAQELSGALELMLGELGVRI